MDGPFCQAGHKKLRLLPIKQSLAKKISDQKCRGMGPNGADFTSKKGQVAEKYEKKSNLENCVLIAAN